MPILTAAMVGAVFSAVDIDRDAAREAAVRELADPRYAADDPSLLERLSRRAFRALSEILGDAAAFVPGGAWGLVVAVLLLAGIALIAVTVGRRVLREQRAAAAARPLFDAERLASAADHRRAADRAEAERDWDIAVQERLRAIVRGLEERGLLSNRPGRTADEACAEAAALAPANSEAMQGLAARFDAVRYGGGHASQADALGARDLDAALAQVRVGVRVGGPWEPAQ